MQKLKIDCRKFIGAKTFTAKDGTEYISFPLEANNVFVGKQGLYMEVTLMENKDGPGKFGDDGFAILEIGKERREGGEKAPIVGNWKHAGKSAPGRDRTAQDAYRKPATPPPAVRPGGYNPDPDDDSSEIPF